MIDAQNFINSCLSRGFRFFTGVPCSFLKPLINYVIQCPGIDYIGATNEGEAVGIASGAYLAGARAVVMCQNSGLGNIVNPLTSLNYPFRIPLLLIITLRGEPGLNDEPQHELMGQVTAELLETLKTKWDYFPEAPDKIPGALDRAAQEMEKNGLPFSLIMKKGSVIKTDLSDDQTRDRTRDCAEPRGKFTVTYDQLISRMEMIRAIRKNLSSKDAIIATTGKIGRELVTLGDATNQLYVVGSMGCAAGIGFGIQFMSPDRQVVVLDGDGSVLMKMGTLATIGCHRPRRFIHIVLDNGAYDSTGGQKSVSPTTDFCNIAAACGYRQCFRVDTLSGLIQALHMAKIDPGPALIHVKVAIGSVAGLGRPTKTPVQVKDRFMAYLSGAYQKQ